MDILMEMAADPTPISRTALRKRTALKPSQLDAGLDVLTSNKLVTREPGSRGRFHLAVPPESLSIAKLQKALSTDGQRKPTGVSSKGLGLAGLDPQMSLAQLRVAMADVDADLCPYYDACVALGGPEGANIHSKCNAECEPGAQCL
jgi:DNA-binding IscR family transcriptional regulator